MIAMTVPTGTVSPSFTRTSVSVPLSSASISAFALSVSISAIASPRSTRSPSFLCQERILPSDIWSPILGMMTSAIAVSLSGGFHVCRARAAADQEAKSDRLASAWRCSLRLAQHALDGVDDLLLTWESQQLEVAGVWCRYVLAGHALDGRVEVVEAVLVDLSRNLAGGAEELPLLLHYHRAVSVLH